MAIALHPDAAQNFDTKAATLIDSIVRKVTDNPSDRTFTPDHYTTEHITEADIRADEYFKWGRALPTGEWLSRFLTKEDTTIGLEGDSLKNCEQLAEQLCRTKALRDVIGSEQVRELILEWLWERLAGHTTDPMTTHVLAAVERQAVSRTIWMPVYGLALEEDLEVGRVAFKTITRAMLDDYVAQERQHLRADLPDDRRAAMEAQWIAQRKRLQSRAAAVIQVIAEPEHALRVAMRHANSALSVLRLFSPAAFDPRARSYWTLMGSENVVTEIYFVMDGERISGVGEGIIERSPLSIDLGRKSIASLAAVTRQFSEMLKIDDPSPLQITALQTLSMYAKAPLLESPSEKLIHMLVALESMLLRNDNEPIQDNLGYRIAFAFDTTPAVRKDIIRQVKAAYELRSKYLHHGVAITGGAADLAVLAEFMKMSHQFIQYLPVYAKRFKTRELFLEWLETRRLGG